MKTLRKLLLTLAAASLCTTAWAKPDNCRDTYGEKWSASELCANNKNQNSPVEMSLQIACTTNSPMPFRCNGELIDFSSSLDGYRVILPDIFKGTDMTLSRVVIRVGRCTLDLAGHTAIRSGMGYYYTCKGQKFRKRAP